MHFIYSRSQAAFRGGNVCRIVASLLDQLRGCSDGVGGTGILFAD